MTGAFTAETAGVRFLFERELSDKNIVFAPLVLWMRILS